MVKDSSIQLLTISPVYAGFGLRVLGLIRRKNLRFIQGKIICYLNPSKVVRMIQPERKRRKIKWSKIHQSQSQLIR